MNEEMEAEIQGSLTTFQVLKEMRTMTLGRLGALRACQVAGLEPFFHFFDEYNPSLLAPYHNAYHTYCLVLNCFEGAFYERLFDDNRRILILAGLFHDFDHTEGREEDKVNIRKAIFGLSTAKKYARNNHCFITDEEFEVACELIRVTKYPYDREPETPLERIIRDADLMQPYEEDPTVLRKQFLGLKAEIEVRRPVMTNEEFGNGLHAWYIEHAHFYSLWGKEKQHKLHYGVRLDNLKELLVRA